MDFIKAQLDRIQQQLNGLSASQKMLTVALVAIMVMTLWWWGQYASKAEMQPVLDQSLSAEDITRIKSFLSAQGIPFKVSGDRILVPAERQFEAVAGLGYAQALPREMKTGFDEIAKQMTPWDSPDKTSAYMNQAKQITLGRILSQFPGVASADVVIDPTSRRGLHQSVKPSAAVYITTRQDAKPDRRMADAVGSLLVGSLAGLERERIQVIIDGHSFQLNDRTGIDMAMGNDEFELRRRNEQDYIQRIEGQLSYMPGVRVSVKCEVNTRTEQRNERRVDPKEVVQKEIETSTRTEETTTSSQMGADPGAVTNIGMSTDEIAPSTPDTSTVEQTDTKYMVQVSTSDAVISIPSGGTKAVGASVMLPRSYFVDALKQGKEDAPEPDEAAINSLADREIKNVIEHVKMCTGLPDDSAIFVSLYNDVIPAGMRNHSQTQPATASMALGGHMREIAIGALAVVSLFMLMMIVKKSAPAPIITMPSAPQGPPGVLPTGEHIVGEAGDSDALLDGMELDEDQIKTQQMIGQVSNMVKENPDAAAQLIKRWMNRT